MDSTPTLFLPPCLPASSSSSPSKLKPPGGSIMLQLHLSPRHSPRGPAPFSVFPHLDTWECVRNGPTRSRRSHSDVPPPSLPAHLPAFPALGGVGLRRVTRVILKHAVLLNGV